MAPSGQYQNVDDLGGYPHAQFAQTSGHPSGPPSDNGAWEGSDAGDSTNAFYAPMPMTPRSQSSNGLLGGQAAFVGNADRYQDAPATPDGLENKEGFDTRDADAYARNVDRDYRSGAVGGGSFWQRRKKWIIGGLIALLIIIAAAVAIPVALNSSKDSDKASTLTANADGASSSAHGTKTDSAAASASASASAIPPKVVALFGTNGSTVLNPDGTDAFQYVNNFGGHWGYDAADPLNINTAGRCQSWSPALNETFDFAKDKVRGVNLGGWLNTEPFIVPGLYEKYHDATPTPIDEWTLSLAMGDNLKKEMTEHYETFVTEHDFMEIAAAGFNFVRIPIGWWAIETIDDEPHLPKISWTYFLKAIEWARKYGLRINLDLHAVPGSQNGWNHSGRMAGGKLIDANIGFGASPMGIANMQRTLNYVRTLAQFISQPQYKDVIPFFGILNEPFMPRMGKDAIEGWYMEAYKVVREVTGFGEGNGPWVVLHDGFNGVNNWAGYLVNADRLAMDSHPYMAFNEPPNPASLESLDSFPLSACNSWSSSFAQSMNEFGHTSAGEWSFAVNDCGEWVTGVDLGTRWEGNYTSSTTPTGSCEPYLNWPTWDAAKREGFRQIALASMDALQNYFFWTWKIGNSTVTSYPPNPMWNYQLGLKEGWSPLDPREADGACLRAGFTGGQQFSGSFSAWQTGGAGAGQNLQEGSVQWPPRSMTSISAAQMTQLPQWTLTGTPITLPGPTYTTPADSQVTIDVGTGWHNPQDDSPAYAKVSGCNYGDPWLASTVPANACGAGMIPTQPIRRREASPDLKPTAAPPARSRRR